MRRLLAILYSVEAVVAVGGFSIVALILLLDVVAREVFGNGIFGAQRAAVFLTIMASYCGLGLAAAANIHLRPRVLDRVAPPSWDAGLSRLSDLITALVFAIAALLAAEFVYDNMMFEQRTPILDWYVWPFQVALFWGFASAALRYLCFFVEPTLKPAPPVTQE